MTDDLVTKTPATSKSKTRKTASANISPEALQAMFDSMAELKAQVAQYQSEAAKVHATMAEDQPKISMAGKTAQQLKNEIATIKAFRKAGFKDAKPRVNVLTFNRWVELGRRPLEGSKSLKVNGMRLFHASQTRQLTKEELAAFKAKEGQPSKGGKSATVTELHPAQ